MRLGAKVMRLVGLEAGRKAVIAIVDYGVGNVAAISNIYKRLDIRGQARRHGRATSRRPTASYCPASARSTGRWGASTARACVTALERAVLEERKPILGICVGMQMLARGSEEGRLPGFGWIDGQVKRFEPQRGGKRTQLPHMGWNDVQPIDSVDLFADLAVDVRFYFLHSYSLRGG